MKWCGRCRLMFVKIEGIFNKKGPLVLECNSSKKPPPLCLVQARKYEQGVNPVIMSHRHSITKMKSSATKLS